MKITEVRLGKISVPLRVPFKTALRSVDSVEDVVVEIHTDTGHTGYGEAPPTGAITGDTTGAIIGAVKNGKKVIAVPRLYEYQEHVDNHQIQLINEFKELNFIEAAYEIDELEEAIDNIKIKKYNKYISNTRKIIDSIESFIE